MVEGVAVIAGYGTGISHGMALKLGSSGFKLALLSRTQAKLDAAAAELAKQGIVAKGFATDLTDTAAVQTSITQARNDLGSVTVLFWNPMGPFGSLFGTSEAEWLMDFHLTVLGLVAAVKACHEDLAAQAGTSAVLVTGGGLAVESDQSAENAVAWNAVPAAVTKAAQRKLVHVMSKQLGREGIYVFQLTVAGLVTGTDTHKAWSPDSAHTGLTVGMVVGKFWEAYVARDAAVWQQLISTQPVEAAATS